MRETPQQRFTNVQMPGWYRVSAWIVRAVAFLVLVVSAWMMTHPDATGSSWPTAGVIIGVLWLVLPSLLMAYIEQRNRIQGLRDGSFQEFLEDERRKSSEPPEDWKGPERGGVAACNLDVIVRSVLSFPC